MQADVDHYSILHVDPEAEPEVIAAAYRRLARTFHSGVNKNSAAAKRLKLITEAYEVLIDPASRREYDAGRAARSYSGPPSTAESPGSEPSARRFRRSESAKGKSRGKIGRLIIVGLVMATVGALIAGVIVLETGSGGGGQSARYIYLAPETPADPNLLLAPPDELKANGVGVVHTFDDLKAATGKDVRSIIVDRESLNLVDKDWINTRLADGVLIAGMRVNFNELTEIVRTFRKDPWPTNFPTDHKFYSYVLHCLHLPDVSEDADQVSLESGPWTDLLMGIDKVISDVTAMGFQCAGTGVNS